MTTDWHNWHIVLYCTADDDYYLPELIEDCIRREEIKESSTAGIVWCGLKGRECTPVPACNEYDTTGGCTFAILRLSVEEAD